MTREEAIAVLNDRDNFLWWEMSKAERECYTEVFDMAVSVLKEKSTDEVVQKIRTAIGVNLYEIAGKFDESCGDAAIYLQELIDKAVSE